MKRLALIAAILAVAPVAQAQGTATGIGYWKGVTSPTFGSPVFTGQITGPVGNCTTAPAYSFTGDTNTGFSSVGADTWCLPVGGVNIFSATSTAVTSTVPFLSPDGTAVAPSYSFANATGSGWYWAPSATQMVAAISGLNQILLNATQAVVYQPLYFSSNQDVNLFRGAANRLDLATGDSFNIISGGILFGAALTFSGTVPTITSGFNTSPTIAGTATRFAVATGTTASTNTAVINFGTPAAAVSWACTVFDASDAGTPEQVASTTTTASFKFYSRTTGLAINWPASVTMEFLCGAR